MFKYHKPKDIAATLATYTATSGTVAGSVGFSLLLLGQPWIAAAAAVLSSGIGFLVIRAQKKYFEGSLKRHPAVHPLSANLGEIAQSLYKATGLKSDSYPLYDLKPNPDTSKSRKGFFQKTVESLLKPLANTHNAMSARFTGKSTIIITEPLLKLLDDKEEKAVLAHEFAHAAAKHTILLLPATLLGVVATAITGLTRACVLLTSGVFGIAAGLGAVAGITALFHLFSKDRDLLSTPDVVLRNDLFLKKKKLKTRMDAVEKSALILAVSCFNPLFAPIAAAYIAVPNAMKVVNAYLSRRFENQADKGAIDLGGDPLALMTALRKIDLVNTRSFASAYPDGKIPEKGLLTKIWAGMTRTHPQTSQRVKKLSEMARKQGVAEDLIQQAATGPIDVSREHDLSRYTIIA